MKHEPHHPVGQGKPAAKPGKAAKPAAKRWLDPLITALLVVVLVGVLLWRFPGLLDKVWRPKPAEPPTVTILPAAPTTAPAATSPAGAAAGQTFTVEVATDDKTRTQGLSGREFLPPDCGMLFVYPAERQPRDMQFWMKGCLIDLDIAFISGDRPDQRRIVAIHTMKAEPPKTPDRNLPNYGPDVPAQFALEAAAGEFARRGVKVGDTVKFSEPVEAAVKKVQ